jgi:hypothetical protein
MDNLSNHLKTHDALSQISKDIFIVQYFLLSFFFYFFYFFSFLLLTSVSTFGICCVFPQLKSLLSLLHMICIFLPLTFSWNSIIKTWFSFKCEQFLLLAFSKFSWMPPFPPRAQVFTKVLHGHFITSTFVTQNT